MSDHFQGVKQGIMLAVIQIMAKSYRKITEKIVVLPLTRQLCFKGKSNFGQGLRLLPHYGIAHLKHQ